MKAWQAAKVVTFATSLGIASGGAFIAALIATGYFIPSIVSDAGYPQGGMLPAIVLVTISIAAGIALFNAQQDAAEFFLNRRIQKLKRQFDEIESAAGTKAENYWLLEKIKKEIPEKYYLEKFLIEDTERRLIDEVEAL